MIWHLLHMTYGLDQFRLYCAKDRVLDQPDSGLPFAMFTLALFIANVLNLIFRKEDKVLYLYLIVWLIVFLTLLCFLPELTWKW